MTPCFEYGVVTAALQSQLMLAWSYLIYPIEYTNVHCQDYDGKFRFGFASYRKNMCQISKFSVELDIFELLIKLTVHFFLLRYHGCYILFDFDFIVCIIVRCKNVLVIYPSCWRSAGWIKSNQYGNNNICYVGHRWTMRTFMLNNSSVYTNNKCTDILREVAPRRKWSLLLSTWVFLKCHWGVNPNTIFFVCNVRVSKNALNVEETCLKFCFA